MTTPYDLDAIRELDQYLPAYKIGSGDITFKEILVSVAKMDKPIFLATGAAMIDEVLDAVQQIAQYNKQICVMQCNTNYTGDMDNFRYVNLNVIKLFKTIFPNMIIGLSDHTPGHSAVIGAVALGARVIEKHFTDDNHRDGPDHKFALNPGTWRNMVDATRELEFALGDGIKRVEFNEYDTVIIQRRAMRAVKDVAKGSILDIGDFEALRPCPRDAVSPMHLEKMAGKQLQNNIKRGEHLRWSDLD